MSLCGRDKSGTPYSPIDRPVIRGVLQERSTGASMVAPVIIVNVEYVGDQRLGRALL